MRKVSTFFSDFNQKDMVIPIKIVSFVIELNYSNTMYGKMKDFLSQTLAEIKEAGLYKEERLIESAQQAAITVKGKEVLNFCANNYLGLSNHPRLIKASQEMMNRRGYGMSSVRFICGTQIYTKNWKLLFPTISKQKTRFYMLPASMQTVVCSNRFSRIRMPLSRIL